MRKCLLFLFLAIALVACNANTATEEPTATLRTVTVQLDWIHTVEYAGFYLAQANGYFAEENLAVEFITNDGSIQSAAVLANGDVDFSLVGADALLRSRENGNEVVAVATVYQRLPLAFMSLASSDITVPADLSGKSVMISMNRTSEYTFRAMLQIMGVDIETVNIVPREAFDESALLNGDVDVSDVFVTNQVVQMHRDGVEVNLILPVDYGVDMYVNAIATTPELIDEAPDVVEGFVRAVVRGMQAAVDNPEAATNATLALNPDLNHDSELESMNSSLPLINPTGSQPGMMDDDTWEFIYGMLTNQGILTQAQNVEDAYDLQFLDAIYES